MSVAQLLPQLLYDSGRSGTVGALFTLHSYLGFGALLGFAAHQLGKRLAEYHQQDRQIFFSINKNSFECLLKTLGEGDTDFRRYWETSQPRCDFLDIPPLLPTELTKTFPPHVKIFIADENPFDNSHQLINSSGQVLQTDPFLLE